MGKRETGKHNEGTADIFSTDEELRWRKRKRYRGWAETEKLAGMVYCVWR